MITSGLNPLIINHTANTISCTGIGRANTLNVEKPVVRLNKSDIPYNKTNAAPIRPQTDNHRGISLD
jgi:hypothetical protein